MSDWVLSFAHRGPDQRLIDTFADQRVLSTEEREIARSILFGFATEPGFETVGDVLDHIEGMSSPERRRLLDEARVDAGLATTSTWRRKSASDRPATPPG